MNDKIAERPQELGNFHFKPWEVPFLTELFNKNDLSAQFVQTADGKNLCIFEKRDEKAIRMARDEFVKLCGEVKEQLAFDRDEQGLFTIKNLQTGNEISFDGQTDKTEIASRMQEEFGFDNQKSRLAAARFGKNRITG